MSKQTKIIDIDLRKQAELAVEQLNEELAKHVNNANICRIHEFLVDMVLAHPKTAEKIAGQQNVLTMALETIRSAARSHGGGIPDNVGFEKVLEKLELEGYEVKMKAEVHKIGAQEHKKSLFIDLDDLL